MMTLIWLWLAGTFMLSWVLYLTVRNHPPFSVDPPHITALSSFGVVLIGEILVFCLYVGYWGLVEMARRALNV